MMSHWEAYGMECLGKCSERSKRNIRYNLFVNHSYFVLNFQILCG